MHLIHVRNESAYKHEELKRNFEAAILGYSNSPVVVTDEKTSVDIIPIQNVREININGGYVARVAYSIYREYVFVPHMMLPPFETLAPHYVHAFDAFIAATREPGLQHPVDGYCAWRNVLQEHYKVKSGPLPLSSEPEDWFKEQYDELPESIQKFFQDFLRLTQIIIG